MNDHAPPPPPDTDTLVRRLTILWFALMAGVGVYAAVASLLITTGAFTATSGLPWGMLAWAPTAAVVMLGAGIVMIRRGEEPDPGAPAERRVARYFTLRLVGLAIQEAAGLLVITTSLFAGRADWAAAAGLVTVGVMSMARPSPEQLERLGR